MHNKKPDGRFGRFRPASSLRPCRQKPSNASFVPYSTGLFIAFDYRIILRRVFRRHRVFAIIWSPVGRHLDEAEVETGEDVNAVLWILEYLMKPLMN
jgi:hypothetical protein